MPAIDPEDDRPKKKVVHEIGQDLSLLSVGELAERVNLLKDEIGRLEAEMARKRASQTAAIGSYRSWPEMPPSQAPAEVRPLPQSPIMLSPGVVEILASLSHAKISASA